jgi:hypothetical protein
MNLRNVFLLFLLTANLVFSQTKTDNKSLVTISGYAPTYVGQTISIMQIEDYFSMKESLLGTGTVGTDSTFSISFFADDIQKVIVRAAKNRSYMYIQPKANYDLYVPNKDPYEAYRPNGNQIELSFFGMDSTDINYKILQFQRWSDEYMSTIYYLKSAKPLEFGKKIEEFKLNAERVYAKDTCNFFKTYVKFSMASLDNIQFIAERNRYEKHDFYIKNAPISYKNDAYMAYINSFYEKMMPRLSSETNALVYSAVLKSSPALVMRALGTDYTLINLRIREMVMIKMLSEEFYSKDLPQTNIVAILDSLSSRCLFAGNTVIAKNLLTRITELTTGGKAPDFALRNSDGSLLTLSSFTGKHVYFHFIDPKSMKSTNEIGPLVQIYDRYKDDIQFLTVYPSGEYNDKLLESTINTIPWTKIAVDESNVFWKKYKIETFPQYILIDGYGYVVAAPALGPLPNGQYETIDRIFFSIRKAKKMEDERR